jgi:hypothetical protein
MDILDLLKGQLSNPAVLEKLSGAIGGGKQETSAGIGAALPTILGALTNSSKSSQGQSQIMSLLDKDGDGDIMDDLQGYIGGGNDTNGGSGIIQQLLGGKKDVVEQAISENSGLSQGSTSNLLTQIAPMVMSVLSKQGKAAGDTPGLDIGSVLGLLGQAGGGKGGGGGLGMITSLLDKDGDGDIKGEAMDIGKKLLGGFFGRK